MVSRNPIDPNNLLEQEQPRRLRRRTITLWLVALSLAFFFVPLYFIMTAIRSDAARLEANIQAAQESLANPSTPIPENQELMDELAQVQGLASQIEGAYSSIETSHTNWPAVMAAIGNYDPAQITLTSLTQADSRITLNGRATDDTVVVAYARDLEESGLFSRVVVQSLKTIASPSATATLTSTAGTPMATPITPTTTVTPAVTPTPGARDEYEVDDFEPKVIFLGQPQLHNFYPVYDVDKAKFLAKAGRYYRVFTSDLAIGVDTFLAVSLGSIRYTNDDYQPGTLNSELLFQAGSSDAHAVVRVTNRGQYGPDKWYQVAVEEVIPTPTPTFTPVPTPTPSPMPSSTATPENTPTPTPDLRDEYEPDDPDPKPIAVGERQTHNFYPDGDEDKVEFLAKAGLYYRVFTSDLWPGVDTVLTVRLDETTYTNDDREPHEPNDYSSEMVFQVTASHDVVALVTVTNKWQYGSDKWYQITVEEIPTPTPTPTPTETLSSSSRPPGVTVLIPGLALAHPVYSLPMMAGQAHTLPPSSLVLQRDFVILRSEATKNLASDRQSNFVKRDSSLPLVAQNDTGSQSLLVLAGEGQRTSDTLSPEAVEFVIVLELK